MGAHCPGGLTKQVRPRGGERGELSLPRPGGEFSLPVEGGLLLPPLPRGGVKCTPLARQKSALDKVESGGLGLALLGALASG